MRVTKRAMVEKECTVDVFCNKCGESCVPPGSRKIGGTPVKAVGDELVEITEEEALYLRGPDLLGLIEVTVRGGYFSEHLQDMTSYTFSLCEKCLRELFDSFKIKLDEKEIMFGE